MAVRQTVFEISASKKSADVSTFLPKDPEKRTKMAENFSKKVIPHGNSTFEMNKSIVTGLLWKIGF